MLDEEGGPNNVFKVHRLILLALTGSLGGLCVGYNSGIVVGVQLYLVDSFPDITVSDISVSSITKLSLAYCALYHQIKSPVYLDGFIHVFDGKLILYLEIREYGNIWSNNISFRRRFYRRQSRQKAMHSRLFSSVHPRTSNPGDISIYISFEHWKSGGGTSYRSVSGMWTDLLE